MSQELVLWVILTCVAKNHNSPYTTVHSQGRLHVEVIQ